MIKRSKKWQNIYITTSKILKKDQFQARILNFVCLQLVFAAITALVSSAPAPEPGYLGGYGAAYAAPYAVAHHAPIVGGYRKFKIMKKSPLTLKVLKGAKVIAII